MTAALRTLIVGLGSPHGDDQVGWYVADALRPHVADFPQVEVRKALVPLDLLDWLEGVRVLHVCDACCGDSPAGTLHRLRLRSDDRNSGDTQKPAALIRLRCGGTHDFGLPDVLDLAARLHRLPGAVFVHAVSGCRFTPGADMIEEVADAVPRLVMSILEELRDARDVTRAVAAAPGGADRG